ncbi:transglutaminase-like domain-containing protein [Pirellulaceae bacterium SH449]
MFLKVGYEIAFESPQASPMLLMLYLHPSREFTTIRGDQLLITPSLPLQNYFDGYGNRCARIVAPPGIVRFWNEAIVEDCGLTDLQVPGAPQAQVQDLPHETLLYLLPSRYCDVDSELRDIAWSLFGGTLPGWPRVQAICDYVHRFIRFDYMMARANRTALETYRERVGVCRDYAHLAIAFCRACNIPARYCTGYLGDIGVPPSADPMDFSGWLEAFLGGQWYTFDARNNVPRIGRVLMARGRDAADVALTTTFGTNRLHTFRVWTDEVSDPRIR